MIATRSESNCEFQF